MEIREGIYDELITTALREALDGLDPARFQQQIEALEEAESPDYLARHLVRQIKSVLAALPSEDRKQRQIALANALLQAAHSQTGEALEPSLVEASGTLLRSVHTTPHPPVRPLTPLSRSALLMNVLGKPRLGSELEQEMHSADRVLMLLSFIQWRGWQRLKVAFEELAVLRKPVRILTTTYIGASDYAALLALASLPNVEMKISLDGRRRRLHAKAWLFERLNGFSSAYVGSANLSGPALEDGIEWTVKLSEVEAPDILREFRGAFDSLWEDPEFQKFHPDDTAFCERVKVALADARGGGARSDELPPLFFDLKPHPYQQATLDQLEAERLDRGRFRNLVVAPTGTGKTLVAAFDYQRQIGRDGLRPKLLFLAHREEILRQARSVFRHVLRDESFGELLGGGSDPDSFHHLFATVQSFQSRGLMERLSPTFWDFAVLDEAHHVPAASYREMVAALQPRILLGLTATPERMDGESILPWFGGHVADEMRLWHAIERQYLVPFDYYGVYDGTDLSRLSWRRGAYSIGELERVYSGDSRRASLVIQEFASIYGNTREARALGFCVSVAHAEFMAEAFRRAGIAAMAVTSQSPPDVRARAPQMLRTREVNVLFTVDLFNEGVDIPEIDCLLFLRPTESATVFLQQMGRGLRLDTGKNSCLVLDFIGNQRREFRFDMRFRALLGGSRKQTKQQIETGITTLPGNCYFRLDKESRGVILKSLESRLSGTRVRLVQEVRALMDQLGRRPSLSEFLDETQYDLEDVYRPSAEGWSSLLAAADPQYSPLSELDRSLARQFRHLLHVDTVGRLELYRRALTEPAWEWTVPEQRLILMLTHQLLQSRTREPGCRFDMALQQLWQADAARAEMLELIEVLRERVRLHTDELPFRANWPLFLHRRYTRREVLIAVGYWTLESQREQREGRLWLEGENTELFFVTLDKSEKHFSPSTRYEDFAVSPIRFHWQSQSLTSADSNTGRRYREQRHNRATFLLFVRAKKEDAFWFLGPVRYVSHTGNRPMSIYWDLTTPMAAELFGVCASLRSA